MCSQLIYWHELDLYSKRAYHENLLQVAFKVKPQRSNGKYDRSIGLGWDDLGLDFTMHKQNPQLLALLATTRKKVAVSPEVTMGGCRTKFLNDAMWKSCILFML